MRGCQRPPKRGSLINSWQDSWRCHFMCSSRTAHVPQTFSGPLHTLFLCQQCPSLRVFQESSSSPVEMQLNVISSMVTPLTASALNIFTSLSDVSVVLPLSPITPTPPSTPHILAHVHLVAPYKLIHIPLHGVKNHDESETFPTCQLTLWPATVPQIRGEDTDPVSTVFLRHLQQ